ncbi:unnamed protein product [Polarella glacialis]|uniref:ABC transporter domain-containing protein n=1 Tax=Polarella glacialis TaxID=89957 RepID=A0A813J9X6_POLGL|nr:unnamed protein product [Polarella glacialis]
MESAVRKAVLAACPKCASDVCDYLADSAVAVLEDENDKEAFQEALEAATAPFLEEYGVSAAEVAAFCKVVACAAFPMAKVSSKAAKAGTDDGDLLCRLPNLMMMYGGSSQPLLRNATLELIKGHRYGIVGANGSGKTTLMGRIANKDIAGLPAAIRVVHLSHDTIVQGVNPTTSVREYSQLRSASDSASPDDALLAQALTGVGFDEASLGKTVLELSGGWQMRLALACAVAQKANLLILDEPTNHLDSAGVQWLIEFINTRCVGGEEGGTAMIVSHDPDFLDQVCSDVVHFTSDARLDYHPGNFTSFKNTVLKGDQAKATALLETGSSPAGGVAEGSKMLFPSPERLGSTAAERKSPVLTLQGVSFQYNKEEEKSVFHDVDMQLSMDSRVGIVGKNGAGKSTLLQVIADRMRPTSGERWYMQAAVGKAARFRQGFDSETPEKDPKPLTESQKADRKRLGMQFGKKSKPMQALLGRRETFKGGYGESAAGSSKEYTYEVQWEGLGDAEISWERKGKILQCGCEAMLEDLEDRLWSAWAGVEQRPLSTEEILQHLGPFGLPEEICLSRKIGMLSSGQKIKLMFGAALWTRPQFLCMDEPTNFLDLETVALLQDALKGYRGGYAIVTHNESFVADVCTDIWTVADGQVWGKDAVSKNNNNNNNKKQRQQHQQQ